MNLLSIPLVMLPSASWLRSSIRCSHCRINDCSAVKRRWKNLYAKLTLHFRLSILFWWDWDEPCTNLRPSKSSTPTPMLRTKNYEQCSWRIRSTGDHIAEGLSGVSTTEINVQYMHSWDTFQNSSACKEDLRACCIPWKYLLCRFYSCSSRSLFWQLKYFCAPCASLASS